MDVHLETILHALARDHLVFAAALKKAGVLDAIEEGALAKNADIIARTLPKLDGLRGA